MELEDNSKKQVFDNKYDRQIRLWGSNGQKCLTDSKICLLNCEPSGVETFKNLVLPGCGNITIVDNQEVTASDLGKNFFVTEENLGQNRAKSVYENLAEMNPDVKGNFDERDFRELIKDEAFIKQFTLIVACEIEDSQLKTLSQLCQNNNVALIMINTNGYIGKIRLQNGVHTIVESKPLQSQYYDMKLKQPFEELQQYIDSFDVDGLNAQITKGSKDEQSLKAVNELMHIPYIVLLVKALKKYRDANEGKDPKSFAEKKDFKNNYLKVMGEKLEYAGNFEQAEGNAFQAYINNDALPEYVHGGVKKVFNHQLFANSQDQFWVLARALKAFYEQNGRLPISQNLPDMESKTEYFLKLKNIFIAQFEKDMAVFKQILGNTSISDQEIKLYLLNVNYLTVLDYNPYCNELEKPQDLVIDVDYNDMGQAVVNNCYQWVIALRAFNVFVETNGRQPEYQKDEDSLYQIMENLRQNHYNLVGENAQNALDKRIAEEICRTGNSKLHNIASIMGGIASQEAVKLITHQFQPLNNTFIFDGILGVSQSINL